VVQRDAVSTSTLLMILPWALFGLSSLFGFVFAILAWRASRRAEDADDSAGLARHRVADTEARAARAEARIAHAEQRAQEAEHRIAQAEDAMRRAAEAADRAEQRARDAEQRAQAALESARRAEAGFRERRDAAEQQGRQAEQRARTLAEWARGTWESRREADRQRAQGQQGSFQAQLDAYLQFRRVPVSFRAESDLDRLASAQIARFGGDARVTVQGEHVSFEFPVDPSLGFRA
jgi:chromosome segregation ATPase